MRPALVMGNWKMNGTLSQVRSWASQMLQASFSSFKADVVVFPPSVYLPLVQQALASSPCRWGAQNLHPRDSGAYTGELSAPMLKEFGCDYVLVGHSERRTLYHEDDQFVAEKFHQAKLHGMIPVLCVGETLEQRDRGETQGILADQLMAVCNGSEDPFARSVIAYEPVWAIGSGKMPQPDEVQSVHAFLRSLVAESWPNTAKALPILYGGSLNEQNATPLFCQQDVDGGLVGGASLDARQFLEVVKCIN